MHMGSKFPLNYIQDQWKKLIYLLEDALEFNHIYYGFEIVFAPLRFLNHGMEGKVQKITNIESKYTYPVNGTTHAMLM